MVNEDQNAEKKSGEAQPRLSDKRKNKKKHTMLLSVSPMTSRGERRKVKDENPKGGQRPSPEERRGPMVPA